MLAKRTNIEIDVAKLKKAKKLAGLKTTREVVDFALARLIQSAQGLKEIFQLRGKTSFDMGYNYKESR